MYIQQLSSYIKTEEIYQILDLSLEEMQSKMFTVDEVGQTCLH